MNFIKLTHFSTGNVTYLKSEDITSVSQGFDRSLVVCNNGQGAYYREGAEYIMDLVHGGESGVCSLGPIPCEEPVSFIKTVPLYQVVAKWDTNFNNDVEVCIYENRLEAIEALENAVEEFQNGITGGLDLENCDLQDHFAVFPTVYLVDRSGEDTLRVTVSEVSVQ